MIPITATIGMKLYSTQEKNEKWKIAKHINAPGCCEILYYRTFVYIEWRYVGKRDIVRSERFHHLDDFKTLAIGTL